MPTRPRLASLESPPGSRGAREPHAHLAHSAGVEVTEVWAVGELDERVLLGDIPLPLHLWRVVVIGAVSLRVIFGSSSSQTIEGFQCPFALDFPGRVQVKARPLPAQNVVVEARISVRSVTAANPSARFRLDATAGAVAFPEAAGKFTALTASTVTVQGVGPVAVPVLGTIPILTRSVLNTGQGIAEVLF